MRFLHIALIVFAFCLSAPSFAAELNGADKEAAKNAFLFVDKERWNDALLHAKRAKNPLLYKTVQWLYFRAKDSGAGFQEISYFIRQNGDWPEIKKLKLRAEEAIFVTDPDARTVKAWFKDNPPITGRGKIMLAELSGNTRSPESIRMIKDGWINGDFDAAQENRIASQYRSALTTEDHIARLKRLLWESKFSAAQRMVGRVPTSYQQYHKAASALLRNADGANYEVNQLSSALKNDSLITYGRMAWRATRDLDDGVVEMLLAAPKDAPYPAKWWQQRKRQIRRLVAERDYKTAMRLVEKHGIASDDEALEDYAEAMWLSGWIRLSFMNNARQAYEDFYALFKAVKFPVSKARAAYWAALAAEKNNHRDIARRWYSEAAAFPTTFYGQLAHETLSPGSALKLPATPRADRSYKKEPLRMARLLIEADRNDLARMVINHLVDNAASPSEVAAIGELGVEFKQPDDGVRAAKRAIRRNIVLMEAGYPTLKFTPSLGVEKALVLGLIRQESEFNKRAVSPANAVGLMQLMPATAREMAKKLGRPYAESRLYDQEYNIALGSYHLGRLIGQFDGSYVLAVAAYNAGGSRARKWMRDFGTPPRDARRMLDWIEMIPFDETRTYVYRVLENTQVYRQITADGKRSNLSLKKDLLR